MTIGSHGWSVPSQSKSGPQLVAEDFLAALSFFEILGAKVADLLPQQFAARILVGWINPSFSPILLLPGEQPDGAALEGIKAFLREQWQKDPRGECAAYFNSVKPLRVTANGWCLDPRPMSLEIFMAGRALDLPPGIRPDIVDPCGLGLPSEYRALLRRNFGADDDYLGAVERAFLNPAASSKTVLLRNDEGTPMAGGTISVKANLGFLSWGTVDHGYRGRGLHKLLISSCLKAAGEQGAVECALTTRNAQISGRGNRSLKMYIHRHNGRLDG